jgi:nitrogen fixation-related uncharacterized protein
MYLMGWIGLLALSLWLGITMFVWCLQNGQFSNQDRARYLPLADESLPKTNDHPSKSAFGLYLLAFIIGVGLLFISAGFVLGLYYAFSGV